MSVPRIVCAVFSFAVGVLLMIGSDAQKFFTLKIKKGLIDDGFFKRTRNPNYLGEILIYLSFGILAKSTFVYSTLIFIWVFAFGMRILVKEFSLQKKVGYAEYAKQSYILLPKFFATDRENLIAYSVTAVCGIIAYMCF